MLQQFAITVFAERFAYAPDVLRFVFCSVYIDLSLSTTFKVKRKYQKTQKLKNFSLPPIMLDCLAKSVKKCDVRALKVGVCVSLTAALKDCV